MFKVGDLVTITVFDTTVYRIVEIGETSTTLINTTNGNYGFLNVHPNQLNRYLIRYLKVTNKKSPHPEWL